MFSISQFILSIFFKFMLIIVCLYAVLSLFIGHNQKVDIIDSAKLYHVKSKTLVCDGKDIATGDIYYEDTISTAKSADNSKGIWRINDAVYVQKEGSICSLKLTKN